MTSVVIQQSSQFGQGVRILQPESEFNMSAGVFIGLPAGSLREIRGISARRGQRFLQIGFLPIFA